MRDFARLPENDRRDIFRATAQAKTIHEAIVEKDFWVCWVLDYLFCDSPWKDKIIFKGGTSLSKAYGAIQRFSEDVDLIIDWSLIGYTKAEAFAERSNKRQDEFCNKASRRTIELLKEDFSPKLRNDLGDRLGADIEINQEGQSLFIGYPQSFSNESIRQRIILEIGPKALHVPNERRLIRSYAAEKYPMQFTIPATEVCTVSAERTFWEKATILHQEANRPEDKSMPLRYSRHYYDLYQLSQKGIFKKALEQIEMLPDVARFKMKFFRCGWAKYNEARPGMLKLTPPGYRIDELMKDYNSMQAMLFGHIPTFDDIMAGIASLEMKING